MSGPNGRRGRIVVMGIVGLSPYAGVAWQALHYLVGLRQLGYDVHYAEDTQAWTYDADQETFTADARFTLSYLDRVMAWGGLGDRWAFRAAPPNDRLFGPAAPRFFQVLRDADALINLTGSTILRSEYLRVPVRIYLETDPVWPQVAVARGHLTEFMDAHTHHFTFGENIGGSDCGVPVERYVYRATRQPVVLSWWAPGDAAELAAPPESAAFTTVASWCQTGKDLDWQGERYTWSKHHEFLKFLDLPTRTKTPLELALSGCDVASADRLATHGWRIREALPLSRDLFPYRDFIQGSRGEFTVAKDQNIRLRTGWFSDRSACYLAAGRPVITQETGYSTFLPTGKGLFAFSTMDDILDALDRIADDYAENCRAAAALAAEYFSAEHVLGRLAQQAGL